MLTQEAQEALFLQNCATSRLQELISAACVETIYALCQGVRKQSPCHTAGEQHLSLSAAHAQVRLQLYDEFDQLERPPCPVVGAQGAPLGALLVVAKGLAVNNTIRPPPIAHRAQEALPLEQNATLGQQEPVDVKHATAVKSVHCGRQRLRGDALHDRLGEGHLGLPTALMTISLQPIG